MSKSRISLIVMAVAGVLQAATWKVSLTEPDQQGLLGVDALTNAIARAVRNDTIELGPGTYDLSDLATYRVPETGTATWGTAFAPDTQGPSSLVVNKTLFYVGADRTSWRDKTPAQETVLKNKGDMRILYGYTGAGRGSRFSHLTFDGGNAGTFNGGAILFSGTENCDPNTCYATNCVFRNCRAGIGGATMDVTCKDCYFADNSASKGGAAFGTAMNGNNKYTNDFINCVFVNNSASGSGGGAVYCERQGQIVGCLFSNNTASVGGAIRIGERGSYSVVSNCTFLYNRMTSTKTDDLGGAINNSSVVYHSTFIGNVCPKGGGGAVDGASPVYSSVFIDNTAASGGATIYSTHVEDCFFTNNVATTGNGGACRLGNDATVRRCTFVGNKGVSGGALYARTDCQVEDCLFASNKVEATGSDYGGGAIFGVASVSLLNCDFIGNTSKTKGGVLRCATLGEIRECSFADSVAANLGGCLYAEDFGGMISNCVFHTSTNALTGSPTGMHVYKAAKVVDSTFTGYGDVYAQILDRCTFDHNDYLVYSQYGSEAMIKFNTATGPGTVRNCLFHDCHVTRFIASDGTTNQIENCTFNGNATEFNMITAHRAGPGLPAMNHIRNCIFTNRSKPANWSYSTQNDFYATATNADATNFLYHCLFDVTGKSLGGYWLDAGVRNVSNVKFAKDNPKLAGKCPDYMVMRSSPAYRTGEVRDWMADATDLLGEARLTDGQVDIGAIQSTILDHGLVIILK